MLRAGFQDGRTGRSPLPSAMSDCSANERGRFLSTSRKARRVASECRSSGRSRSVADGARVAEAAGSVAAIPGASRWAVGSTFGPARERMTGARAIGACREEFGTGACVAGGSGGTTGIKCTAMRCASLATGMRGWLAMRRKPSSRPCMATTKTTKADLTAYRLMASVNENPNSLETRG